ncbi:PST-A protein [Plasmodium cynomolgi strain B]|uniref:PST-A protein n=1 Tax=Plasmodium cynomolgi (strain B) TaxID=1120755 RepID=K6URF9_PLACD|nr:PST-A protein [Plasmodium cynomolgi strain B]GAB64435.1 PST-A protein [Plasmodium cynomolgi strain B]
MAEVTNKPAGRGPQNRPGNRPTNRGGNKAANRGPNQSANQPANKTPNRAPNGVPRVTQNETARVTQSEAARVTQSETAKESEKKAMNNAANQAENKTSNEIEKKTSAEPEKKAAAEPEKKAAAEPEKKASAEPEKKAAAEPEKKTQTEPEKKTPIEPEKKIPDETEKATSGSANKETRQTEKETPHKVADKVAKESPNRDANKAANRDANKAANRDADKAANRDANKAANRDANKAANKAADGDNDGRQNDILKTGSFISRDGLELKTYEWVVNKPVGIIILVHALNSHVRFEYLKHNVIIESKEKAILVDAKNYYIYKGSWIEQFNKRGYSVYGLDMRGHGQSGCVQNVKTHVNDFQELVYDVLEYANIVYDSLCSGSASSSKEQLPSGMNNIKKNDIPPFYFMGLSMGGNIVLRVLELREKKGDESIKRLNIKGVISLAGMISLDDLKKKPEYKYFYLPIAKLASTLLPTMRLSPVLKFEMFPYINDLFSFDANCYHKPITNRFGNEILKAVDALHNDIRFIPEDVQILIVHSVLDSACSYTGVSKFFNSIQTKNKELFTIDDMDHILPQEPGNEKILKKVIDWLAQLQ